MSRRKVQNTDFQEDLKSLKDSNKISKRNPIKTQRKLHQKTPQKISIKFEMSSAVVP
jgi:hypothetical protein